VYGAAEAELIMVQRFLDRNIKRRYISYSIDIHSLLEKQDKKIRTKVMGLEGHLLYNMMPEVKNTGYQQFKVDEFLTTGQIQSFFSRTAVKLRHAVTPGDNDEETDDNI